MANANVLSEIKAIHGDFQLSCKIEMNRKSKELTFELTTTGYLPLELSNGEVFRILQLVDTRDASVIAEGLLNISSLAEQLKLSLTKMEETPLDLSAFSLPPPHSSLTVNSPFFSQ